MSENQTAPLVLTQNLDDADGFYAALVNAHTGLTKSQSDALNARLLLILANQIGDTVLLRAAINKARTEPNSQNSI
ncbi:DUF2783 domain-containing protein [Shimia marina]|uniref:DUF2783 domain-containing protein n=1 Tax=Shimia marina TaxID=321267 RepID=A0A0P1EPY1_9RHOB|nr:DUF2783 domain-containing protein [Shimia marina]CUH52462.1 hypothetical protein SHM7688_01908 [Shimia marina]SFE12450.1 Protein of unknown function [Shimia marina]